MVVLALFAGAGDKLCIHNAFIKSITSILLSVFVSDKYKIFYFKMFNINSLLWLQLAAYFYFRC